MPFLQQSLQVKTKYHILTKKKNLFWLNKMYTVSQTIVLVTLWSLQVHWVTRSLLTLQSDETIFCQTSLFHHWLPKETKQLVRQLLKSLATNLVPHKIQSPLNYLYNSDPHWWIVVAHVTLLCLWSHLWMNNVRNQVSPGTKYAP